MNEFLKSQERPIFTTEEKTAEVTIRKGCRMLLEGAVYSADNL